MTLQCKFDSLGISVLNDPTMQVWREETVDQDLSQSSYSLPSKEKTIEKVQAFNSLSN